jgi:hypothetical protein
MATALDLVKGAMRLVGVLAEGETPEAEDANIVLSALNAMLDSWNLESLLIYHIQDEAFPVSAGVGEYGIGTGQTFNTTRPVSIESAFIRDGSGNDHPLTVFEFDRWDDIPDKDAVGRPDALSYEPSYPYGQIKLWPAPSAADTLHIRTFKPLSNSLTLATQLAIPTGYERAIRFNLAVEIAPEFEREASPTVQRVAIDTLRAIKTRNTRVPQMGLGLPVACRFNVVSGD